MLDTRAEEEDCWHECQSSSAIGATLRTQTEEEGRSPMVVAITESFVQRTYKPKKHAMARAAVSLRTKLPSPSSVFPILRWMPALLRSGSAGLLKDFICGLTVASIVIPQGMAYGVLAGIPAVFGLYTAVFPSLVYTFSGTCRHLSVGPFALISMLTAEGVHAVVPDPKANPEDAVAAAEVLSLLVGLMLLCAGILRLGFVATFLSDPVRIGYTTAVSIAIPVSQLKYAFQVDVPRGTFIQTVLNIWNQVSQKGANYEALGIFSVSLITIWGVQTGSSKIAILGKFPLPAELIVVLVSTAVVAYADLDQQVETLGNIPVGLPRLVAPQVSKFDLSGMLSSAAIISVMVYITAMSVSKTFGRRFEYVVDNNQELVSLGLANIAGSFASCFPAAASLSRTAVAGQVGIASPMHGVFTVLLLVLALLFAGPYLSTLPMAGLAAIVVMAFKSLLLSGYEEMKATFHVSTSDFVLWNIAFWSTLVTGVTKGIAIAILVNFFYLLLKSSYPEYIHLSALHRRRVCRDHDCYQAEGMPGVMVFKFCAPLHFANREVFATGLWEALLAHDQELNRQSLQDSSTTGECCRKVEVVVVDFSLVAHIDMSACRTIEKLREDLFYRDTRLVFAECLARVYEMMDDMGLLHAYKVPMYDIRCFVKLDHAILHAEGAEALRMSTLSEPRSWLCHPA